MEIWAKKTQVLLFGKLEKQGGVANLVGRPGDSFSHC
jgi:hypothetical protein